MLGRYSARRPTQDAGRPPGRSAAWRSPRCRTGCSRTRSSSAASAINVARFSYNRIGANPAVTSGLLNADYGINVPHNLPAAQGLANIVVTGFFNLGDAQQPFVDRVNEVFQFTDDVTWVTGAHTLKIGVDVRKEHMVIAFVNRPNGDYTFTGRPPAHAATPPRTSCSDCPPSSADDHQHRQDGTGWLYAGYVQDDFRPLAAPDGQRRACATSCRCRSSTRTTR